MDLAPFGMSFRPFATGPDPAGYYPAPAHDEALALVVTALLNGEPVVSLTGEPGVGKTLLAHLAVSQLPGDTITAFVTHGSFERRADLLQAIMYDLGLPFAGRPEQELRLALTDFAYSNLRDGRRLLIVLDEAHLLSPMLLEEIRQFGNLETPRGRAVQVILVGLPGLLMTLERPELAPLAQRLTTRARVPAFQLQESIEYLGFQVERADAHPDEVFSDEAVEVIARGCRGIPRLLNQATLAALRIATKAGLKTIDVEAALEAMAVIPGTAPAEYEEADAVPLAPDAVLQDDGEDRPDAETWPKTYVTPQRFVFAPMTQ
ncbi:MAG: AAA family ATPase [Gemmataceae bacterium]|nr:AAA family ATPase [Gemmataceae bacterium]